MMRLNRDRSEEYDNSSYANPPTIIIINLSMLTLTLKIFIPIVFLDNT